MLEGTVAGVADAERLRAPGPKGGGTADLRGSTRIDPDGRGCREAGLAPQTKGERIKRIKRIKRIERIGSL